MQAVIKSGGKQYLVSPGDIVRIERLEKESGAAVEFDQVLLINNEGKATVGNPLVAGALVLGSVVEEAKSRKVIIFKFKRKKQYKVTRGHRQLYTAVKINEIKLN
ncbi:MAG: 50S ribosomal protein L21 [Terriglobia bacterium]